MKPVRRWSAAVVLIFLTVLFLNKGLDLWSLGSNVDGHGIGLYLLGFEINDRVPEESIPSYATGFFILSGIAFVISTVLVGMNLKMKLQD
ncbi:hypothetical protein GWK91_00235 [Virgibacillus sp. MSP4-1]|uniref:hypothetical protein n=1 Tax=Virgibacillus sp. MSP4-1 TaxID=2700081 RepID=UPI00039B6068|nr:hypothetical protein [Virgibacillus sp. MSP4-1]QHS21478.1 hypothetical protein GWK91_00235 [Virgibacillus sp. MSP4-1]